VNAKRQRRTWREKRSRAALLWGGVLFAALQLSLAIAIESWWPELRDPDYAYKMVRLQRCRTHLAGQPLIAVMLGSSRTVRGLHGSLLEGQSTQGLGRPVALFNFGLFGAGPVIELLTLKRLVADRNRPDLLLLEVLPPLLAGQLNIALEAHRLPSHRLWLRDLPVLEQFGYPVDQLRRDWWQSWPVPCYSHRFAIISRVMPALLPYQLRLDCDRAADDLGWVDPPINTPTPERRRLDSERAQKEYAGYFAGFRLGEPACRAIRETLELCRQEGIAAALVLMPEDTRFRSYYPPGAWEQVCQFLQALGQEYAAPIINAREWIDDDGFSDGHHLLPKGAELFTRRLSREALPPLLEQVARQQHARGVSTRR
jgi:hypothetical protein